MKKHPETHSHTELESASRVWLLILGIVFLATNLRAPITSVGPLVEIIRADLGISNTLAGLITTLPLIAFALLSPVAPKLARRYGMPLVLFVSVLMLGVGVLIRSAWGIGALLIGTVVLGLAISVCNVLMPSLIKEKFPLRIGLMIGVYSVAMNLTGAIASGISVPVAEGAGLGWKGALAIWAVLALIAALLWAPQLRRQRQQANISSKLDKPVNVWKSALAWYVTLYMGLQSLLFYVVVTWLPDILKSQGMTADSAGWTLSFMQLSVLPITFLMPIIAGRVKNQVGLMIITVSFFFVGIGGILYGSDKLTMLWAIMIGISLGSSFSLAMMLFGLRTSNAYDAAELSGMAQSVGYLLAAVGPTFVGYLHDATGGWRMPMYFLVGVALLVLIFGIASGRNRLIGQSATGQS
ncbi:CynX/NimT family MFS transporter [Paenibacillus bouchesdurhonensis]|uniref:CynX/NimT family MFS transporter n=1 Tax=Paenibacillus bouchesdurhonensis TaxID=1870990 RepID=UPI000DA5F064|nr:MFS transporter [Paenibacillus bouchesdurhonensis]